MEELLLKFISKYDSRVKFIKDWEVKDADDYIVNCIIVFPEYVGTHFTDVQHAAKCLVNIAEFKHWKEQTEAVRWI